MHWFIATDKVNTPGLRNQSGGIDSLLNLQHATTTLLNFHPALAFTGNKGLQINLGTQDLRRATYFSVYQSTDTASENSIWHISNNQKTSLILTTHRIADLQMLQYMNYTDVHREQPKVSIYVQRNDSLPEVTTNQWWNIGAGPASPKLPAKNFKGVIPELIAYNRVLNSTERIQVATYLALKYGITLTEPGAKYINSAGERIWEGYDYPDWHKNIAGICRDDSAGLHQSIATSSNEPGMLTISTQDSLADNTFLLWGDNGKSMIAAPRVAGLPLFLQKTWLIKESGNAIPLTTELVIDTKTVDAPLPLNPVYWLAIDPKGKGEFNSPAVEFRRMKKLDKEGKAFFEKVILDKDRSGNDVLGIIAGQDLLLAAAIDQPACSAPATGKMKIKVLGGLAPFQLIVKKDNLLVKKIENAGNLINLTGLTVGKYFLSVTDAAQRWYTDSFYINNKDAPLPATIGPDYALPPGRPLQLNAAEGSPADLSWEWTGPGNFQSFSPQVSISTPGLYTLRCSKNGCVNVQDILIKPNEGNILSDVTVFPNPTRGSFTARVKLDKPAPVTMNLYSLDGKLLFTRTGENRMNYLFSGELITAGTYEAVFTSGLSKANKRIVVVK